MPRTISAEGRTITVPDDATDDEINQIFSGISSPASSAPVAPTPIANHGWGTAKDTAGQVWDSLKGMVSGPAQILGQSGGSPEGILQGMGHALVDPSVQEWNTPSQKGVMIGGTNHPILDKLMRSVPILGPMTANADRINQTQGFGPAAASVVTPVVAGELTGGALGRIAKAIPGDGVSAAVGRKFGNPAPNYVAPTEQSVRGMVKSLNLPIGKVEPMVQNLLGPEGNGSTIGIIRHYADQAGLPINTPLDAAKLASRAADDSLAHYNAIRAPFNSDQVSVRGIDSPLGSGEGKYASLGEINDRISDINAKLKMAHEALANGNPTQIAIQPLEDEARSLNSVLYRELSKKTGIPQPQLQTLRQQYGKLYDVADNFTRAANKVTDRVNQPPSSVTELASRIGHKLVGGGEEGVFNRNFRSTLPDIPAQEPSLPSATPPSAPISSRAPIWKDIQASKTPIQPIVPDAEGAAALRAQQTAQRLAQQNAIDAQTKLNQLRAQEEVLRAHQGEQTAQELAANRNAQAEAVRDVNRAKRAAMHPVWRNIQK